MLPNRLVLLLSTIKDISLINYPSFSTFKYKTFDLKPSKT